MVTDQLIWTSLFAHHTYFKDPTLELTTYHTMSNQRPKPWEVSSGTSAASVGLTTDTNLTAHANNNNSSTTAPELPSRPISLSNSVSSATIPASTLTNPYSSNGFSNPYSSMGNSYGSLGSYGTYGGGLYGSRFGSGLYGSGYSSPYGMSGYSYGGMNNGYGGAGSNTMVGTFTQSTEATFQLIESIIGTFSGFSQMLESFYYATHNSFFTMISVAEQLRVLKEGLGSVLGIFTVMKFLKKCIKKFKLTKEGNLLDVEEFIQLEKKNSDKDPGNKKNTISLKPLLIFLCCAFGLPLLMKKIVMLMAKQQQERQHNSITQPSIQIQQQIPKQSIDPKKLEFARALFDFTPENEDMELRLRKGDLLAILSKKDSMGNDSSWWKCRSRDGRLGFVPYNYLEVIKRNITNIQGEGKKVTEKEKDELKKKENIII